MKRGFPKHVGAERHTEALGKVTSDASHRPLRNTKLEGPATRPSSHAEPGSPPGSAAPFLSSWAAAPGTDTLPRKQQPRKAAQGMGARLKRIEGSQGSNSPGVGLTPHASQHGLPALLPSVPLVTNSRQLVNVGTSCDWRKWLS